MTHDTFFFSRHRGRILSI